MSDVNGPRRVFRLTRAYSLASLLGILVVSLVMAYFYRSVAVDALMRVQNESNADLTRAFANAIWGKYAELFTRSSTLPLNQLSSQPEMISLADDLERRMRGMRVVKIKIYNPSGLTVFSTEAKQIGEYRDDYPGFVGAMRGEVMSEIVFRDKFNAYDQVIEKRDLLSSYIPIRYGSEDRVVGVFELYSDITTLLEEVRQTEYKIMVLVAGLMLGLYTFLLVYIRRADGIIKLHDKKEQELQQERIRYMAEHDQLTGLPNRTLLLELLNKTLERARSNNFSLALFYLDINRFKLINDNLGHEVGDQVLLELVRRIRSLVREQEVIARMGGDEFVLVQENIQTHRVDSLASRIINKLTEPLSVEGSKVTVTLSMGITLFPDDGDGAENLLKNAEAAMLRGKELGRNRYAFFTEELNARAVERFNLEYSLQRAMSNHEFELHYQPRVDARSGKTLGAEALIRWHSEDEGVVSPELFVPVLEELGLIVSVGRWVLREACRQCKTWHEQGYSGIRVSVNLSMMQLHSDQLLSDVRDALLDSDLEARFLELELTESVLAEDSDSTIQLLRELKSIGTHLSIDDFGTGYSSLSYLMHFPIDYLKVDQAFVRDAITNPAHASLTRAIVAMAKSLNLKTVAEGVELEAHQEFLVGLACDELQGYLFSRPLPAPQFLDYLEKERS